MKIGHLFCSLTLVRALIAAELSLLGADVTGPPVVDQFTPAAGSEVRELVTIEVQFDRPVVGVDAADLLINGVAAGEVTQFGPGQFVFTFAQPAEGTVIVSWRPDHSIADPVDSHLQFAGGAWGYLLDTTSVPPELLLSEFMADNDRTLRDDDGDKSDWIEIANGSETEVNLEGWFLTDEATHLTKWRFPNVAIGAREFLVIFASGKDRAAITNRLHTNFKLGSEGDYLALVSPRTNVVSEFGPTYPTQFTDVSYGRAPGALESKGYFSKPTPGAPNAESGAGFAAPVNFSRVSSTFLTSFDLVLGTGDTNAVLRFTLDGTVPTNSSPVYVRPLAITNSVQVRARTFRDGLLPGPPRSETFLLLSNNVVGFASDLPVIVLHSLGKGAPNASRQNFAHLSLFEPRDGVTSLTNAPTLVTRAGVKIRGSSTEGYPKVSLALELWDEFNLDQKRELLGMPAESDWVLYAPNNFDPVLIHNPFIHQLSREMGRYSPRTRFVEVYLNKSTGAVASNHYNGIYVLEEKIKIGPDRLAIDELRPEHNRLPEITGGYLMKIDRLDPGDSGFSAAGQRVGYVDPKEKEIRLPQRDPQEQYLKTYFDQFSRVLNGTNWLHPTLGYRAYVDVDGWIDFHVVEMLSGNVDALVLSTYFHKSREGKINFGPHWDFDRALGSTDGRDSNPRNWSTGPFFSGWWSRLFRDPDFWQQWIDRYQELRQSHFSQANMNRLIDELSNEVRQAQPRERIKWRVSLRGGSYQGEVNLMKNWLSNRTVFIDRQLVSKPRLATGGGRVTPGFLLKIDAPTNATVYYTLDGSDPRLAQGALSPRARLYTSPIVIEETVRVNARARNLAQRQTGGPPISSPWSGPAVATFTVKPPPLLLTELMFHPAPLSGASAYSASDLEFLELKNVSDEILELDGYHFTSGIQFAFTRTNAVTRLAPGERVLLVKSLAAFRSRYPNAGFVAGEFEGNLGNGSQRLALAGPLEETLFDFTYHDDWQPLADGFGFSLVPLLESGAVDDQGNPARWRLSARVGGSPGAPDPEPAVVPHVLINELLTHPSGSEKDALELFNASPITADISGWYLTDDFQEPKKIRLPSGPQYRIEPNSYSVLTSFAAPGRTLAFSRFGEEVYLFSADATGELTGWSHGFVFGAAEAGVSFGRVLNSVGAESFAPQQVPTFGAANTGPRVGPVVLSEIMYKPAGEQPNAGLKQEYVELWNTSAAPVSLTDSTPAANGWRLRGAVDFDFPPNTTISGHGFLVVVGFDPKTDLNTLARFRSRYGFDDVTRLTGPWRGDLTDSGGTVRLLRPGETRDTPDAAAAAAQAAQILVEQVSYSVHVPWPEDTAGTGLALLRAAPSGYADDPSSWTTAFPTPGAMDSDSDGLPDPWELSNGLDPRSAIGNNGYSSDPDQDGYTNQQEFFAGTKPLDPESCLRAKITVRTAAAVVLTFPAVPGRSYTVEMRDKLTEGTWQAVRNVIPATEEGAVEVAAGKQVFYRIASP